jgi:hypothetical protein
MKKSITAFILVIILTAGCAPKPVISVPTLDLNVVVGTMMAATLTAIAPTPAPPTETPAPEPTATQLPPGTLMEEFGADFTFPNADWSAPYEATNPTGQVKHNFAVNVIPDFLQINLPEAETYVYTFYKKEMPADVVIDTAYFLEGKRYSEAAVTCRVDPASRTKWYEFRVNHLDKSGVIYYFDRVDVYHNPYQRLAYAKLPVELFSDRENRIRGICKGSKLTLIVNDIEVTSVENNVLPGVGLVGLGGLVHNQVPLNVNFNYFHVSPPAQ